LAAVSERMGDHATMMKYLEQVKKSGAAVGPRNLPAEQREIYFAALRRLSAEAEALGDVQKAEADAARDRGDEAAQAAKDAEARPHYEEAVGELRMDPDRGGAEETATDPWKAQ